MLYPEAGQGGGSGGGTTETTTENTGNGNGNGNDNQNQSNNPPQNTQAEDHVAKAYEKLRAAEDRQKELERENRALKPENETLTQENTRLTEENKTLKNDLQVFAAERVAQLQGFVDPEAAVAILLKRGTDISDKDKTEKALKDLATEKEGLVNGGGPSGGPINPQNNRTPSGNQGMNDMIRRASGRAV